MKNLLTLAAILLSFNAFPQVNTKNLELRIDKLVTEKVKSFNVPGYSVAVYYKGDKIIQKGYGLADIGTQTPVTPETVFGLASVTKTFTGLALMILVEEGKVKLDDKLSKYYDDLSPEYQKIEIRQLAEMSAGVPPAIDERVDWKQQIKKAQATPLHAKPGTKYNYSNVSYRILGGVIEKASGQSYMEFLESRVLKPLGMNNTKPTDQTFSGGLAVAYNEQREPIRNGYKKPDINFSAGMLASNTVDMVKYAKALVDGKFLSKKGYDILWNERPGLQDVEKGTVSGWAFGWGSTKQNGMRRVGMNGGLPGVSSSILIFPDDDLIIVGLCNVVASGHELTRLVAQEVMGN